MALTLARLVEALRLCGWVVSVVRPRQQSDSEQHRADANLLLVGGVPLPRYPGLQLGLPAAKRLRRRWTERPPSAVYVATEGLLGLSAVRAARRLGIPVFSGFHTNFHSYSDHYRVGWLASLIFRYLCWFHRGTAGTVVASADVRSRLHAAGLGNVHVVGRGVDRQLFSPAHRSRALRSQWGVSDGDLVAITVGRIAPEKNLDLAIAAYRAMQGATRTSRLVLVGDGPARAELQGRHRDLIFSGLQTGEDLARHYASADVFLFPSETDTFGNVTLEAMASGLAVVAYDYAAAHQHVTHGHTGRLAPLGNEEAFVAEAIIVARELEALPRMRRSAREHVASLDWQRIAERFATLLSGDVKRAGAASADAA